jgi:small conductance mechanosensitive channel
LFLHLAIFLARVPADEAADAREFLHHVQLTAIALAVAFVVWRVLNAGIDRFFARRFVARLLPRVATISSLSKSLGGFVVLIALALLLMNVWAINVAPAVWSAGIVTAALAFGAQAVVRDILSGFYCLFEDQYDVGERIELMTPNGSVSGIVEAVSLRSTRIVDDRGKTITVPNGNIVFVTNASRLPTRASIRLTLPLHGDASCMRTRMQEMAQHAAAEAGLADSGVSATLDDITADGAVFRLQFDAPKGDATAAESLLREKLFAQLQSAGWIAGGSSRAPGSA